MIRAVIADDEPLVRTRVRRLLADVPDFSVVAECGDGLSALECVKREEPECLFLDVQMPGLNGFEVLDALQHEQCKPAVVFITAYDHHAVRAFEVCAIDYLLKPIEAARFSASLQRVRADIAKAASTNKDLAALAEHLPAELRYLGRFVIRAGERFRVVPVDDVEAIEAVDNYVNIHASGQSHLMRGKIGEVELRLDPERFVRIHRSALVNVAAIRELQLWYHGEYVVILRSGRRLHASRTYSAKLRHLLDRRV